MSPLVHLPCSEPDCWRCAAEAHADEALDSGQLVFVQLVHMTLVLVPDVLLAEALANGQDVAPREGESRLVRYDGRTVHVYRMP